VYTIKYMKSALSCCIWTFCRSYAVFNTQKKKKHVTQQTHLLKTPFLTNTATITVLNSSHLSKHWSKLQPPTL